MHDCRRRIFLRSSLACGAVIVAVASGVLKPVRALAADWPAGAFEARSVRQALEQLYGDADITDDKRVKIKAQTLAENGARVPVEIYAKFDRVQSIAILIEKNIYPLAGRVFPMTAADAFFSARIKMAESSDILAIVRSDGRLYSARHNIEVVVGGCAG